MRNAFAICAWLLSSCVMANPVNAGASSGIGGLGTSERVQSAADVGMDDVAVPSTVLEVANKLRAILPPKPTTVGVSVARIIETRTMKKTGPYAVIFEVQPLADGSTRVLEIYERGISVDREMVGMVQLRSKANVGGRAVRGVDLTQVLTLNAGAWEPGAEISFTEELRNVPSAERSRRYGLTCRIGEPVNASVVNSSLVGRAWPMDCHDQGGTTQKGFYIDELGYFLMMHGTSAEDGNMDVSIDRISIER
jgi:hypothetical protein